MIVKILPSAYQFAGIRYNEQKCQEGTATLMHSYGFEGLLMDPEKASAGEKKKYLEMHAGLNPRVKKKQFHAILSTRGKSHSLETLKAVAVHYMQQMGFEKSPYLIYGHSDTEHNHVHIVASRVDREGKKVNDSFEKKRSVEIIARILEKDLSLITDQTLREVLQCEFSTLAQFKLLLEEQGYRTRKKEPHLEIIKYGKLQHKLDLKRLEDRMRRFSPWPERKKQLREILHAHQGIPAPEITDALKKDNIQLVFHYGAGHELPYGYTIIDRPYKQVLKGSSVYSMRSLLGLQPQQEEKKSPVRMEGLFIAPGEEMEEGKKKEKNKKRKR